MMMILVINFKEEKLFYDLKVTFVAKSLNTSINSIVRKPLSVPDLFWTGFLLPVLLSLVKKSCYWRTVTGRLNSK